MANIVDYVRNCTDTFENKPLNRVDGLVFSWLANMRIPEEVPAACTDTGATIAEIGSQPNVLGLTAPVYDPLGTETLLRACAASPRFGTITACRAVDDWSAAAEKQFSATTFLLPQGAIVAFRSTDNTLVGWKENFNMTFRSAVPAQEAAQAYVERVAAALECPVWLCGHSKGGNLALYATACCDPFTRLRIERCFAYDAPGLSEQVLSTSYWNDAAPLVERIVPEESLVGLIWENRDVEPVVIRSENPGLLQHAALSWIISGDDFATLKAITYDAYRTGKRLNVWLRGLSTPERERFVELLYKVAQSSGESTSSGLIASLSNGSIDAMLHRIDMLPADDQVFFRNALEDLAATMLLGPAPSNPQTPTELAADAADKIDDFTAKFNSASAKLDKYLGL